jgi:hypothetical protein
MSADFTKPATYKPAEPTTDTERAIRGHMLAAKRADDRGAAKTAKKHRLSAQLLRKDIPVEAPAEPARPATLRATREKNSQWATVGGDPIHSIDKEI